MNHKKSTGQAMSSGSRFLPSLLLVTAAGVSSAAVAQGENDEVVREAQPSQSVQNVLREEHALFSDRLTIEPGISYSYSDRSELALSGLVLRHFMWIWPDRIGGPPGCQSGRSWR